MESSKTWRTEALKSFAISKFGMQGVWRPDTPSEGYRTWAVAGCQNDVARLVHFSQWFGQHIRIGYAIVRVWWSRVPRASPCGSPDRGARCVSSWGIRMELLRIAMCAPCHQGEGSLHHAHADGHSCDVPSSVDIPHPEFCPGDVPLSPDISHPTPDTGWERKAFQPPWLDISGSSDNAYLESFAAILHSAAVFSWSFPICATDILRYFALDIWCPDRHFEKFCFRYFMSKFPKSPCNSPIIGFLSP